MRKLDRYDLEAEAEGSAINKGFKIRKPQGKRIIKQRNMHARGNRIIQTKVEKRHV